MSRGRKYRAEDHRRPSTAYGEVVMAPTKAKTESEAAHALSRTLTDATQEAVTDRITSALQPARLAIFTAIELPLLTIPEMRRQAIREGLMPFRLRNHLADVIETVGEQVVYQATGVRELESDEEYPDYVDLSFQLSPKAQRAAAAQRLGVLNRVGVPAIRQDPLSQPIIFARVEAYRADEVAETLNAALLECGGLGLAFKEPEIIPIFRQ